VRAISGQVIWTDSNSVVSAELGSGEKLLWSGSPLQGIRLRKSDMATIPFSILWGGFAIFWEAMAIKTGGPIFMRLWGIPFVAVGLYMMFGRFIYDAKLRERTCYGVTNQRCLIISGLFGHTVKSINLRTITDLSLEQKSDGSGTIIFGPAERGGPMRSWRLASPNAGQFSFPCFDLIQDSGTVYEVIRDAQNVAATNPS